MNFPLIKMSQLATSEKTGSIKPYPKANLRSSPSGGPLLPRVGLTDRGRSSSSIVAFLADLDNLS